MVNTIRKVLVNGQDHLPPALFFRFKIDSFLATQCYFPNGLDFKNTLPLTLKVTFCIDPAGKIENQNPEQSLLYKAIKYN